MSTDHSGLVVLTTAPNELEATLFRDALQRRGIDVEMVGALTSGFRAEAPGDLRLLVRETDLAKAKQALADLQREAEASDYEPVDWSEVDVGEPEPTPESQRTFHVLKHATEGYAAVKAGFSLFAFLFTCIWLFVKRLWLHGIVVFLVLVFLHRAYEGSEGMGTAIYPLLGLAACVFVGMRGNDWRREWLEGRGYQHVRTVKADTSMAAIEAVEEPDEET